MSNDTLHELVEAQVRRTPNAAAVRSRKEWLSYRDLDKRANQLANYLRGCGVGPDTIVGICLERSLDVAVAVLGVLKAGGAYLPLDPTYPRERRLFMVEDSGAAVIIGRRMPLDTMASSATSRVHVDIGSPAIGVQSETSPPKICVGDNLAYVIYTSGSTGRPKGVMIPHKAVRNYVQWAMKNYGLDPRHASPFHTPLGFDLTVTSLFPALAVGATVKVLPESEGFEGLAWALRSAQEFRPLKITPAHLRVVDELLPPSNTPGRADVFVIGGEALTADTLARWRNEAPRTRLFNEYGPTETTVGCCFYEIDDATPDTGPVPIGRSIDGASIYILNDALEPVGTGVTGELYIGGVGVARGYHGRPGLTATRFLPDPFTTAHGARMYRSGDLARCRADGILEFIGRSDDQVKILGYRVELGEIDAVLAQHPAVSSVATIAQTDHTGEQQLHVYVVCGTLPTPASDELRTFISERLPQYMVPSAVTVLDAIPLTSNGKVDRRALSRANQVDCLEGAATSGASTSTEAALVKTWAEVLGLSAPTVDDNLFVLGGSFITAAQVIRIVRSRLGISLRIVDVFQHPTIARLALAIDALRETQALVASGSIMPARRTTSLPLSFAQERIWFIEQMYPSCRAYRFHASVHLHGPIDVPALERTLNKVVRRHEILRTTFHDEDGQPAQVVHAPYSVDLSFRDLKHLSSAEAEAELQIIIAAELGKNFDSRALPLIRWKLVCINSYNYCLVHSEHGLIHDGWSLNVFLSDLVECYHAFAAGRLPLLAPLPIQFADYATWERKWTAGPSAAADLAYWKSQLYNLPVSLMLPYDRSRPPAQTFVGRQLRVKLPAALVAKVADIGRGRGATVFMTFLAAFYTLLYRCTGETDIAVGTTVANRDCPETEHLIGIVVNNVVLRVDFADNPTFLELLDRVKKVTLDAYLHQRLPFSAVVNAAQPLRNCGVNPLFQVMFSFLDAPPPPLSVSGLEIELERDLSNGSAKFDWQILALPHSEKAVPGEEQGLTLLWEYNSDLFDEETVVRSAENYVVLLKLIVENATQRIAANTFLMPAERHQLGGTVNLLD